MKNFFHTVSPELLIWIGGMIFLAFYPVGTEHFTICPLKNAGIPYCPGCGIGMSIHQIFHLDFTSSFNSHPLGVFALTVISWRIITLLRYSLTQYTLLNRRNYNG